MFTTADQVTDLNKNAIDVALGLAKLSFEATERVIGLNLEASKDSFAEASKTAKALSEAKDAQSLLELRAKITEANVEKALEYSRTLYEVAAETQAQLSALFESQSSELNKNFAAAIEKAVKSAPVGADVAIAAVKSTIAASNAALDSVNKAAKQVTNLADASVKATSAAANAAVKASKKGA
jgi:phasin family protein